MMTLACGSRSASTSSTSSTLGANQRFPVFTSNSSDYALKKPISPCFNSRGVVSHGVFAGDCDVVLRRYSLDELTSVEFRRIREEIRRVRGELRHPNILPYLHVFGVDDSSGESGYLEPGPQIWIVTPFCDQGSALDLLSYFPEGLPERAISYIGQCVLRALAYVHSKGFVHRAVKASHVLLCSDGRVLLTGMRCCISYIDSNQGEYGEFPSSMTSDPEFSGVCIDTGSAKIWRGGDVVHHYPADDAPRLLPWMAPEILEQNLEGYGTASDIYSFGILCCELGNGEAPYEGLALTTLLLEKLRGAPPYLLDSTTFAGSGMNYAKDSGVGDSVAFSEAAGANSNMVSVLAQEAVYQQRKLSPDFHDVVNSCLKRRPDERPTAVSLGETHPFFLATFRARGSAGGGRVCSSSSLLKQCRGTSSSSSVTTGNPGGMPDDLVKVFKSAAGLPSRTGPRKRLDSDNGKDHDAPMSVKRSSEPAALLDFTWDFN